VSGDCADGRAYTGATETARNIIFAVTDIRGDCDSYSSSGSRAYD
jgi:hypothetical protein